MIIQIPHQYSERFGYFFTLMDQNIDDLGIISYGISISTLEEVFHKVGHLDDPSSSFQGFGQSDDETPVGMQKTQTKFPDME